MLRNYLKVAFRNLWKNKTFSFINIFGLAVGLSCFLLITLYVLDELSYDRYNQYAGRIFRINSDIRFGGNDLKINQTSDMMGEMLKKDYAEVEQYTRLFSNSGAKFIRKGNEFINEPHVAHVDSTFFDVFTLPSIAGNTKTALFEPYTVVITERAALKYFGTTDAVGKTLETKDDSSTVYKVTAVIRNIPKNAHFNLDFLFSMKNVDYNWGQFISHNFNTYLLLKPGVDYKAFEKKFLEYTDKYVVPEAKQYMDIKSMDDFKKAGNRLEYTMIPLTRIHLYSDRAELTPGGNIQYVYIFSVAALFILLIACINFMNLTTARSANRAREVGIRKVLGTERKNLMTQFLTESVLMTVFSFLLALGITYLVLPLFNDVAGKTLGLDSLFNSLILPLLITLPFVVGLLAGSYPAFYLSSFKPIEVLKGKLASGSRGSFLRSFLVVFQFFISILLITGTIIIYRQLNLIQTKNLGYNKDQVLIINDTWALGNKAKTFKEEVLKIPGVTGGTLSSFLPVHHSSRNDNSFSSSPVMNSETGFNMQTWSIDYDYLETMGMKLLKGRNFSREYGTDSSAVIINETTAKFLKYDDPIGQKIYNLFKSGNVQVFTIIGVVKDFNFESIRDPVRPLSFFLQESNGLASFKVKAGDIPTILNSVGSKWKSMSGGMPFSYRFLDDSFSEMYRDEQRVGKIALSFSVLAILIACLGLFGLATYIAEQRTKEIGIRKVLGANVQGIIRLLSKDFVRLVLIAFLVATPIAWWAMNRWLQDFNLRVSISWWVFALSGFIALFIALATVSFQAIKAAVTNPVKNLRTE